MDWADFIDDAKGCVRQCLHPLAAAHLAMTCRSEALIRERWFETHLSGPRSLESYILEILKSAADDEMTSLFANEFQKALDAMNWHLLLEFGVVAKFRNRCLYKLPRVYELVARLKWSPSMAANPIPYYIINGFVDVENLVIHQGHESAALTENLRALFMGREPAVLLRICLERELIPALAVITFAADPLPDTLLTMVSTFNALPHLITLPILQWWFRKIGHFYDLLKTPLLPLESIQWLIAQGRWSTENFYWGLSWSKHLLRKISVLGVKSDDPRGRVTAPLMAGDVAGFVYLVEHIQLHQPDGFRDPLNLLPFIVELKRCNKGYVVRWLERTGRVSPTGWLMDPKTKTLVRL